MQQSRVSTRFRKLLFVLLLGVSSSGVWASDHDDGETENKGRNLNITDVYAFREDNQSGNPSDAKNLVVILNTNPRSLPSQQYFFSTKARYDIHFSRVVTADKVKKPVGKDDVILRFTFSEPTANGQQKITLTVIEDGKANTFDKTAGAGEILTTPISESQAGRPISNNINMTDGQMTVFAGLREDPFFFDVEQFFKVRAEAVKTKKFIGFLPALQAKDFTHNYNVNAIVVRVPIAALQSQAKETVFDVWTTISIPKGL